MRLHEGFAFVATLAFSTLACAIDDRQLTVAEPGPILLLPDGEGFVDGSNAAGITGYWRVFSDALGCQASGYSPDQCSMVVAPANDGVPFVPSGPNSRSMCTSGISAQVLLNPATMAPDYGAIWGAGIGLDFNNPGARGGRGPYDATAHKITGMSFVIDSPPSGGLIVELPVPGTDDFAYWGGLSSYTSPVNQGLNVFRWADVGGPLYLPAAPPFERTKILAIQFGVPATPDRPRPYQFCISDLSALTD